MKNRSTETPAISPFSNGFRFSFVQICKYSIYIRWFFSMLKCGQRTLNKNCLNLYSNRRMARKKILSIKIRRNVKNWSETNVKVSNEPLKIELRIFVLKKRRWSFLWKEMPNAFTALRACHPQYTSLEKLLIQFHIHWNILCAFFFFFGVFLCRSTCHFKRRALHRFVHCTHKSQRNALDFSIAHHACNQSVHSTSHVQTAAIQQTTKWSETAMHRKQMGKEICC